VNSAVQCVHNTTVGGLCSVGHADAGRLVSCRRHRGGDAGYIFDCDILKAALIHFKAAHISPGRARSQRQRLYVYTLNS
jgi:hypothetical protein